MDIKPIFIIKVPRKHFDKKSVLEGCLRAKKQLEDYHTLVIPYNGEEYGFEAFYPSDFDEKKMEEIKKMVSDKLEEI